jgi:hypothetical protein
MFTFSFVKNASCYYEITNFSVRIFLCNLSLILTNNLAQNENSPDQSMICDSVSIKLENTNDGTIQLQRSQNMFPQILVILKISHLATSNKVRGWGKVAPERQG